MQWHTRLHTYTTNYAYLRQEILLKLKRNLLIKYKLILTIEESIYLFLV